MIINASKKAFIACLTFGLALSLSNSAFAVQAVSMEELLEQVKSGRVKDAAENKQRIADFHHYLVGIGGRSSHRLRCH